MRSGCSACVVNDINQNNSDNSDRQQVRNETRIISNKWIFMSMRQCELKSLIKTVQPWLEAGQRIPNVGHSAKDWD
ncbi:hypothetical protein OUZ56_006349 [Daphnia magna]|uniref:Uncharacterized protein n=1 Tax=Daphnia magna TaxID=35525 RepID=A0ABQ9YVD6_9CRUS|nr:hypothetical protein OUZ56_006349 [Daphnia magna]